MSGRVAPGTRRPTPSDILARSAAYRGMDAAARERMGSLGRTFRLQRGARLFVAGAECPGIFVLASGRVRLFQASPSGKVHTIRFAEARQSFAEAAVIGEFPCPVSAEVMEEGLALKVPADVLRASLQRDHELCLALLRVISLRNRRVVERAGDIALRDAAGRLSHFLLDLAAAEPSASCAEVRLTISKRELAQHLNLTSETLSRVLRRLSDDGLIEHDLHHQIRIVEPDALRRLAGGA
ncbi:MAG: Crp/Fnr family transcriptional regulator [Sandaracinaceae bacterium]